MAIYQLGEHAPQIHPTAFVADNAQVIGRVHMAEDSSVWFGVVVRGDTDDIRIGRGESPRLRLDLIDDEITAINVEKIVGDYRGATKTAQDAAATATKRATDAEAEIVSLKAGESAENTVRVWEKVTFEADPGELFNACNAAFANTPDDVRRQTMMWIKERHTFVNRATRSIEILRQLH